MIFVTVGTHYKGFERLIKEMDNIAEGIDEEVIMQIGATEYRPKNGSYFDFADDNTIMDLFRKARIIISHAGAGTILSALALEKPLVLVPRLKEFFEAVDNQQLELTEILSLQKKAIAVYNINDLEKALKDSGNLERGNFSKSERLVDYLRASIRCIDK